MVKVAQIYKTANNDRKKAKIHNQNSLWPNYDPNGGHYDPCPGSVRQVVPEYHYIIVLSTFLRTWNNLSNNETASSSVVDRQRPPTPDRCVHILP